MRNLKKLTMAELVNLSNKLQRLGDLKNLLKVEDEMERRPIRYIK